MSNYISILPEILLLAMLTSAFGILYLTTVKILRQTGLFQKKTAMVMALLVSVSVVAGSAQLLLVPNSAAEVNHMRNVTVNYSLLPLAIVAGVIVMLELLVIAATTAPDQTDEVPTKEPVRSSAKPRFRGRPRKEKPVKRQSKEVARPAGEMTKKGEGLS